MTGPVVAVWSAAVAVTVAVKGGSGDAGHGTVTGAVADGLTVPSPSCPSVFSPPGTDGLVVQEHGHVEAACAELLDLEAVKNGHPDRRVPAGGGAVSELPLGGDGCGGVAGR